MPVKKLITQQEISSAKMMRSRELRHEMTLAECKLWERLRANRLEGFHFRRQQIIEPYIVDFYCHQAALVIEVDGGIHLDQLG
jgi:very-short-patch-repair endonuclease